MKQTIIIGTGLAGYQLARSLRALDKTHSLLLITEDEGVYYHKPLLSTSYTQQKSAAMLASASAIQMAQELSADIRTHTCIQSIDPLQNVICVDHEKIPYQQLVLACGADVVKPLLAGDGAEDVISVNDLNHYATLQKKLTGKKSIAILGAGLIGCEFANDLSNVGFEVSVISPAITPLDFLVPMAVGTQMQMALENRGVLFHMQCLAEAVHRQSQGYEVILSDGTRKHVDCVLSAIGLTPRIGLAKQAQLSVNRGIRVNRYCETSAPNIYALGDCAEMEGEVRFYIAPMKLCAEALAKTLTGERSAVQYPPMPISLKTPAYPLVVCTPPKSIVGEWHIQQEVSGIRASFYDSENQLRGFVLTQEAVKERMAWVKRCHSDIPCAV